MNDVRVATWHDVKAQRTPRDEVVAQHVSRMADEERAYALKEIRQAAGITQEEMARRLDLTQPTISAFESGDIGRSALDTIRMYVAAIGGELQLTATFGDRHVVVR